MKKIIIAGCGFSGFAAALELKRLAGDECEIEVISHHPLYVHTPALAAIPFSLRQPGDISLCCAHDAEQMIDTAITGGLPQRRSHEIFQAGDLPQQARARFEQGFLKARLEGEIR